jgi:hypothetical protein
MVPNPPAVAERETINPQGILTVNNRFGDVTAGAIQKHALITNGNIEILSAAQKR